jgi:AraC family transcriptional regulator
VIRTQSSLTAARSSAQRDGASAWGEDALKSGRGSMDAGAANWLRAAVTEILKAVNNELQDESESAKRCMQRAAAILQIDPWFAKAIEKIDFRSEERSKPIRGGLAPWQIRRVTTHIESNLQATIRINDLATVVKLSSSHFCRAFRQNFDDSPHRYVMRRRVEQAQEMMLTTDASLGQIAADCGLADQAHLNRLFRRFIGESPGAWRRARARAVPNPGRRWRGLPRPPLPIGVLLDSR